MTGLPGLLPLFPLPNVVLFPGLPLPLHIFEPRYCALVRDLLQNEERLIGMTLLRGEWRESYFDRPEIFDVGCGGRVVNVEPLPKGRYNILVQGLREFRVGREHGDRPYRRADVSWGAPMTGEIEGSLRARLRDRLDRLVVRQPQVPGEKVLRDPAVSDELLVNFFCFAPEFSALEKQGMLEAGSLDERARRLAEAVDFALNAGAPPASTINPIYH